MLTRLKVHGFKNLVDVDVRFGPFNCIAGLNGVGKSNLFDAICFLSSVANGSLLEAALSVRSDNAKEGDIRSIFHKAGERHVSTMRFEVEMIVPESAVDDLGQNAIATATHLRYILRVGLRQKGRLGSEDTLEILEESLTHFNQEDSKQNLFFKHSEKWRKSVVHATRRSAPFISTEPSDNGSNICVHLDKGTGGKIRRFTNLPRTVLSVGEGSETPTILCARRELQSWKLLQLEPSALRKPDNFNAPVHIDVDGAHLPATLFNLAHHEATKLNLDRDGIYQNISNRVAEIAKEIRSVWVDKDEKRQVLSLMAKFADGNNYPARSLSDGTLRFLALAILELDLDPQAGGVLCLEEPENGIHPARVQAMIELLGDIAADVEEPKDETNPLRQIIINTHSPIVVAHVRDDSLLYADEGVRIAELEFPDGISEKRTRGLKFSCMERTWRSEAQPPCDSLAKGHIQVYLNPIPAPPERTILISRDMDLKVMERADYRVIQTNLLDNPDAST